MYNPNKQRYHNNHIVCAFEGCKHRARIMGMCTKHYSTVNKRKYVSQKELENVLIALSTQGFNAKEAGKRIKIKIKEVR